MRSSAQLEERISKCEEIFSRNPNSLIFAALSDAYRKKGDLARAFHVCTRGLKLHPDYGPGHLVMAKINLERGLYSEAEKELALAVQSDGKTRSTELLLVNILLKKGQFDDAKKILERLKAAEPENQTLVELLEDLKRKADLSKPGYDVITAQERLRIEKVVDLKDAVRYLKSLPGIKGAAVVGEDGLMLESALDPNFKDEQMGAAVASITGCVKGGAVKIGFGDWEYIFIETQNIDFWIIKFELTTLVLCCAPQTNLGALRIRVNELLEHLHRNIE